MDISIEFSELIGSLDNDFIKKSLTKWKKHWLQSIKNHWSKNIWKNIKKYNQRGIGNNKKISFWFRNY